jgi:hypothetical protein
MIGASVLLTDMDQDPSLPANVPPSTRMETPVGC